MTGVACKIAALISLGALHAEGFEMEDADSGKLRMEDDPTFQRKAYQQNMEEDPGCDRSERWGAFRQVLLATEPQARIDLVYQTTLEWNLENATIMDEEAKVCILGLIAVQFLFAHFLIHEAGSVEAAVHSFRMLDTHVGAMHPDVLDASSGYGSTWPVTTDEVDRLRRFILKAHVGGGSGGPDRRRRVKNAFGLHDDDWKSIWEQTNIAFAHSGAELVTESDYFAAGSGAPRPSFSVYVYDPDEHPGLRPLTRGSSFCKLNQWGMEVALHDWFLSCPCRTDNPDEADFFFVPHYTGCLINHEDTFTGCDTKQVCAPSTALFEKVLEGSKHYHKQDGGSNHILVWGSGMGADGPFASWRHWVPNAIFLMTEPELWNPYHNISEPSYMPHKDIIVPGKLNLEDMRGLVMHSKPLSRREFLGHFIGWPRPPHASIMDPKECADERCPLNVRSVLLAMRGKEPDMHVDVDVPYVESFLGLTNAVFCFVPRGKSAWSSRYFQTFFAGCIPVLLNDQYEPPFGEIVEVRKSAIKWPMHKVPELVAFLRQLVKDQPQTVRDLQEAGTEWRCWYAWPPSSLEWSWIDLNRSKFNSTCAEYHRRNAFVAVTQLLARKVSSSRHRFFWPGSKPSSTQT